MKRTLLIIIGLATIAIALVMWRSRDQSAQQMRSSAAALATGSTRTAAKRVDPRTQKRGSIAGTVRDEAKTPIAGATVCADIEDEKMPSSLTREPMCTTTDAAGGYLLRDMIVTTYAVVAGAKTFRPKTATLTLGVGEAKLGLDLVLESGGVEIRGAVSDVGGGPIAHAKVRVRGGRPNGRSPLVDTDERGEFSLPTSPGDTQVSASAEGYVSDERSCSAPCRLEIELTPESSIAGVVVDGKTRAPIEGARVQVNPWGADESEIWETTDPSGSFRANRLTAARYDVIATTEGGYGRSEGSVLTTLGQPVEGVVINVFPAATIAGRIVLTGETPAGCKKGGVVLRSMSSVAVIKERSDANGNIIVDAIRPGIYHAEPWCEGHATHETYAPLVVASAQRNDMVWEVETGATIRGRVTDRRGQPISGASISGWTWGAGGESYDSEEAVTAADGRYELHGLRIGIYRLYAWNDAYAAPDIAEKVETVANTIVVKDWVLDDAGSIDGTVVDAQGHAVPGLRVEASLLHSSSSGSGYADARGVFRISRLRPGTYSLQARRGLGYVTTDETKVTVAVGTTSVRMTVRSAPGSITGTVVDGGGTPISDAYVTASPEGIDDHGPEATRSDYTAVPSVMTSSEGAYALKGLAPGTYMVRAFRPGAGEVIARNVRLGSTLNLVVNSTGSIDGAVKGAGAAPLELRVIVEDRATGFSRTEAMLSTGGHFAARDLPAGHYVVTVETLVERGSTTLDLAAGEERTGVIVELAQLLVVTGRIVDLATRKPLAGAATWVSFADGTSSSGVSARDPRFVTDATGRFTHPRVPAGRHNVYASNDSGESVSVTGTIEGKGTVDVGDLAIAQSRVKNGEQPGELGITLAPQPPGQKADTYRYQVLTIDPSAGAGKTELKVGDVITTVDGIDVTGEYGLFSTLLRAPVGTKVLLGLARGVTVTVILSPRPPK